LPKSIPGAAVGILPATQVSPVRSVVIDFAEKKRLDVVPHISNRMERYMNRLIWLVGAIVIILFILGYFGLR
jgi:hypothetical protein